MCTKNQLNEILGKVTLFSEEALGSKLDSVILYGSYARGDFDDESDIDILLLADVGENECHGYSMKMCDLLTDTEIENDIVISVHVVSYSVYERYKTILPFYKNVSEEGIKIAG